MTAETFWLEANDRSGLFVNQWLPAGTPKAMVLLAHGMAEHSGRYARLGQTLSDAGFGLYAHDQRGHGKTAERGTLGYFADNDGWCAVVSDLASLIARFERLRQGPKGRSALIEWLSFGSFNKAFKPNRTAYDWLSRDPVQVDAYASDPLCGFRCTNQLWIDLLGGLQQISKASNLAQIDTGLPLLIMGGECDPVSEGKRLTDLATALRKAGNRQLQLNLYPQARHELFNETNRDEVMADVIEWLNQALSRNRPSHSE